MKEFLVGIGGAAWCAKVFAENRKAALKKFADEEGIKTSSYLQTYRSEFSHPLITLIIK